jgi:glycosyltransferase involved in cell wall biosynthesis
VNVGRASARRAGLKPGLRVGFIGSLDFRPNQEAAQWILDELWPRIAAEMPEARLAIAGSNAPEWLRPRVLGHVPDAQEFMSSMAVMIAPLFAGGGMRIKVLEAMALGKPVVATPLGAGGIDAQNLVIANDAASFAAAVVRLLRDPEAARRLGEAAREEVARKYDSDAIARRLVSFYEALLRRA